MEHQDRIYKSLARGELTLITGCDRLFQFAREHYPRYLRNLAFRNKETYNPSLLEVVQRLDSAKAAKPFQDWPGYAVSK